MTDTVRELVVVGVDGSEADQQTLTWASAEATRRQGELLIVHAQDVIEGAAVSESPVSSLPFERQDFADGLLSRSVEWVSLSFPALSVRSLTRREKPAQLLLEQSERAALLVLGTHGDNRFVGALLGSVSQKLAAHAVCPVVVLPADLPHDAHLPNTVVVGVSRSAGGRAALRFAFAEAQRREAELVAVRCWHESALLAAGAAGFGYITPPLEDSLCDGEKVILDDCLAQIQPEFPDVKVRAELAEAPTDPVLIEYSAQAALMVVGCRHEDGHRLSRLGPTGSWLLHNSKAPLAVVGFQALSVAT
jgi:nucleotide-binding universal stress UspA family protein